jgi:lysophospholipase L1-like esterase
VPTPLQPGQTLIFLGDHTTPDEQGYVATFRDVLARFFPNLRPRLISAGSPGQTAKGLASQALAQIVTSSRPDWLVVGLGLTDAFRELAVKRELEEIGSGQARREQDEAEATFGPELRVRRQHLGPVSDVGPDPEPPVENAATFQQDLGLALKGFASAGVNLAVLTTLLAGCNPHSSTNRVLKVYNQAIRAAAEESGALLIDVEKASRDVLDRALNYKQTLALTTPTGEANAQGQALLARTVLNGFGVLPQPGWRPLR